jgi:hypothetical protein
MCSKGLLCLLVTCLWAVQAPAVFEDLSDPDANAQAKVDGEAQAPQPEKVLQQEVERQEAARVRAEKIRRLPPSQVQAWAEGRLSDEDLDRLSLAQEEAADVAERMVTVPRSRVLRLFLSGLLVVFLAGVLWRRRRQAQLQARPKKTR